ncbi:MAG TPA: ABC transporter ATP-binding protein [Acidimicrobiales bacterium]|nr:ABC transporter ATP-binding protein [Acidimicrobiales bacterium]
MSTTVVEARGVVKRWGRTTALAGIDVTIRNGVTGLLGANGAGKTTFLGLTLGLTQPDEGTLEVLGLDPTRSGPEVRALIGYAPEHDALAPDVRAHDLVRHFAEIHGIPKRDAQARASDVLWHVGLGEERFRAVGTMSTGQRQRVKLAAALAHDPALLLLDEPTNGLDPMQRDSMLQLIRRIGTDFGIAVVLSSHLLEEVERVCDAVVIINSGTVVRSGTMHELRGGGGAVLVEPDDRDRVEEVAAALRQRDGSVDVAVDGPRIVVLGADGTEDAVADLVRDVAVELDVGLRRMQRRLATLEDVYLEGTAVLP